MILLSCKFREGRVVNRIAQMDFQTSHKSDLLLKDHESLG